MLFVYYSDIVPAVESDQIIVTHFIVYVDIAASPKLQAKHNISVVPTVVIFKDGEEMERFQADISFSLKATKEDMQEVIDELIMSDF